MIARAVCGNRKIIILDEATSALDNVTQKQVTDSLEQLGCTRVVVAHRLSTVRHCDRILVLDGGRIAEEGTYDELMDRNGIFTELFTRQRLEAGMDAHLSKHVDIDTLVELLAEREAVDRADASREA